MIYVPNTGELLALRNLLASMEIQLGLYKNQVVPDGNTTINSLLELPTGGGRAYARKTLASAVVEAAKAADKWYLSLNAQGKAEGEYSNAAQSWVMNATDVGDGNTAYGSFGFVWVLPFDGGTAAINVGDTVTGQGSGATGIVTAIQIISGTWGTSDAAGYLYLKTKSATAFQDGENLQVSAATKAVSNTQTENGGDAHKKLLFVDAFSSGHAIDTVGLTIEYTPKLTMSTS